MNQTEAEKLLSEQLTQFSSRSHSELARLVETHYVEAFEVRGTSGTSYQIEIQFFWDEQPGQVIRVAGTIDDGGIRAFVPLSDSVLIAPAQRLDQSNRPSGSDSSA